MRNIQIGLAAVGMLTFGLGTASAAEHRLGMNSNAEGIYAKYAAGTGSKLSFEVKTLGTGSLKEIADVPFGQLVKTTDYLITVDEVGTDLANPRFVAPYTTGGYDVYMASELKTTAMGFERAAGYPIAAGSYRKLLIATTISSETKQHEALEFCWPGVGRCTVFDPTVMFMESVIKNRESLLAQGWGPTVAEEKAPKAQRGDFSTTAVCGLASSPTSIGKTLTWNARTQNYYNSLGGLLISKNLGGQQAGVRCNSTCYPAPYGYSNISSCQGYLGWSCACDNKFGNGITSRTGKWIAETKCTHKYAFSASASGSVTNFGSASVSISWTLDGTTDGNGGYYLDTCGYF